ncbi:MAG: cytochrome c [Gammaproteobacteria bacterium]|nr:cytochrome c [Gammaproteobacteria bacterium]
MNKLLRVSVAGILSCCISMAVHARGDSSTEDAIEYRQAVMEVIAWNFGRMGAILKSKALFDAEEFAKRAAHTAFITQLAREGFVPGSDKGETDAKPQIWTEWDDFKEKMTALQENAAKLAEVAKTATARENVAPQFKKTGKTCKGCHKKYKKK